MSVSDAPYRAATHDFVDLDEFLAYADDHMWTDGFPVIPPTLERVDAMVAAAGLDRFERVGLVPPRKGDATVEIIAANAVMAGCRPEHMPVVLAALRAALDPAFELSTIQPTTHPCALMVLVSGPIVDELGINCDTGCLGPGPASRVNIAIGRAMRLILLNIGGGLPQSGDMATQGSPAKISFCFGENAEANPWEPFHVTQGFAEGTSTVTVAAAEPPHNLNDHVSNDPESLLLTFSQTIASMGANNAYIPDSDFFVLVAPDHAQVIAGAGWSRRDAQEYIYEHARIPFRLWKRGGMNGMFPWHAALVEASDDDTMVPMTGRPDQVHIVVAGGAGRHSSWVPTLAGNGPSVTRAIGNVPDTVVGNRERRLARITTLLEPMAEILRADGYDLEATWAPHAELRVEVVAGPDACEECLVPATMFRDMVAKRLADGGEPITTEKVRVAYPAKGTS